MMTAEHCRNASTNKPFSNYLFPCDENTRKDIRKLEKLEKKNRFEIFGHF